MQIISPFITRNRQPFNQQPACTMSSKEEHPSYFRNSRQHPNSRAALFGQNILSSYYPLEFWDNISKIIAKKYALSERYRRQWVSGKAVEPATEFPKNGISTIFEDMKLMAEEEPNIVDTRKVCC